MLNRHEVPLPNQQDAFQIRHMADIQDALSSSIDRNEKLCAFG